MERPTVAEEFTPDGGRAAASVTTTSDKARRSRRAPVIISGVALVLAACGVGSYLHLSSGDQDTPTAVSSVSSTPPVESTGKPSPTETPSSPTGPPSTASTAISPASPTDDKQAVAMLNRLADQGEKDVPIDDRYLISLSLKWVGIKDPRVQSTAFTATDIWNHFQGIISDPRFRGNVKIVRDTHFGNQLSAEQGGRGRAWIALIDPNLPTLKAGSDWCEANFTERGTTLEDLCSPRKVSTPHD